MLLTTELRLLGREGRSGALEAVAVEVTGLPAEGEVVVIAEEIAGLPAVGAVDNAFPVHEIDGLGSGETSWMDGMAQGRSSPLTEGFARFKH